MRTEPPRQRCSVEDLHIAQMRVRLPDQQLHALVLAIDEATSVLGFTRGPVWMHRAADASRDPWEGIATWERHTAEAAERLTFNGISLMANGGVGISVHGSTKSIGIQVQEGQAAEPVASTIARYIEAMDAMYETEILRHPLT